MAYPFGNPGQTKHGEITNFTHHDNVARSDYAANGGERDTHPGNMQIWPDNCWNGDCGPSPGAFPTKQEIEAKAQVARDFGSNGIVHALSTVRVADVRDGTSNTYMAGEKYLNPDFYTTGQDSGDNENMYCGDNGDIARWTYAEPLQDQQGFSSAIRFGSAHPGACQFVFCDGSVHTVTFSIDLVLHRRLGNRSDGEMVDLSDL